MPDERQEFNFDLLLPNNEEFVPGTIPGCGKIPNKIIIGQSLDEMKAECENMTDEVRQVQSDLVVKATAKLQTDINKELSVPDPEPGALARMYKEEDKSKKKKKDK
jgi:hypothetical protein